MSYVLFRLFTISFDLQIGFHVLEIIFSVVCSSLPQTSNSVLNT